MAYERKWNPDALPAHAEPEQAAQALSNLQGNRKPSANPPANSNSRPQSPARKFSPPSNQQSYKPSQPPTQNQQSYKPSQPAAQTYASNHNNFNNFNNFNNNHNVYHDSRVNTPPPSNYGQSPPSNYPQPSNYGHNIPTSNRPPNRPHAFSQPSRVPIPLSTDSADLFPLFRAANASQSGSLSQSELSNALVNGDYTSFDPYTIKMLLRLFSSSPNKDFINHDEFRNLWRFLGSWRELFERFDEDKSGKISLSEFSNALVAFGYRLSQPFIAVLYDSYNDRAAGVRSAGERRGSSRRTDGMSFDLFVQACISLKRMTEVFKGYDDDRDGYITLSFEEFLTEIIGLRE